MPAEDQTYNGYPNKPTWSAALWIDNDRGINEDVLGVARIIAHEEQTDDDGGLPMIEAHRARQYKLADWLKERIEYLTTGEDGLGANLLSDLVGWVLAQIDYHYLAGSYLNQIQEDDEYNARHSSQTHQEDPPTAPAGPTTPTTPTALRAPADDECYTCGAPVVCGADYCLVCLSERIVRRCQS